MGISNGDSLNSRILELLEAGYSVDEISRKLRCGKSRIYKLIERKFIVSEKTEEDVENLKYAERLVSLGRYEEAVGILSRTNLYPHEQSILLKIPDNYLTPDLKLAKISYKLRTNAEPLKEIEKEIDTFTTHMLILGKLLYFYMAMIVQLSIWNLQGKLERTIGFYKSHRKRIKRLVNVVSLNILGAVLDASTMAGEKSVYREIMTFIRRRLKSGSYRPGYEVKLARKILFSGYMHIGDFRFYREIKPNYDDKVVYAYHLLGVGKYRELIRKDLRTYSPLMNFYITIAQAYAMVVEGFVESAQTIVENQYNSLKVITPHVELIYNMFMAFLSMYRNDEETANMYLSKIISQPSRSINHRIAYAIVSKRTDKLRNTPRENLLKYFMKGDYANVMKLYRKFNMHFPCVFYAVMLKKRSLKFQKYHEISKYVPYKVALKVYGKGKNRFVQIGSRKLVLGTSKTDRAFLELLYGKYVKFNTKLLNLLRRKFGDGLFVVENGVIKLNANVHT